MNLSPLKDHGDLMLLERLVETSLISGKGLQWRWSKVGNKGRKGHVPFQFDDLLEPGQVINSKTSTSVIWNRFVKASEMEVGYLYKPLDPTYPFVDLLWVERDGGLSNGPGGHRTMHAIQCTLSDRHPKPKTAYESLRRKLDFGPENRMIVYFATLRKYEQSYINGSKPTFGRTSCHKTHFLSFFLF